MLQTTDSVTLTISTSAVEAVQNILTERNLSGYALRVYVAGSGCSGTQFGMALDNNFYANDSTIEHNGVKVVIDENSLPYLRGAHIDFVNDPTRGAGFVVDSPNAQQGGSCSCGSGAHEHEDSSAEAGGCACGGSCSCNN